MSTVKKFEDLEIWIISKELAKTIYKNFNTLKDFGFKDQIQRAAVSVMNNIAEGYERNSNKEFQRFLKIAKGSAGEVRSMVYLAFELDYIDKQTSTKLISNYDVLSRKLSKLITYLNANLKPYTFNF